MPGNRKAEPQGSNQVPLDSSRPHVGGQVPWGSAKQCLIQQLQVLQVCDPTRHSTGTALSHCLKQHLEAPRPAPCLSPVFRPHTGKEGRDVVLLHQPAVMEQTLPGGHGMSFHSPELCEAGGAACKELFSGSKGPGQLLHMR